MNNLLQALDNLANEETLGCLNVRSGVGVLAPVVVPIDRSTSVETALHCTSRACLPLPITRAEDLISLVRRDTLRQIRRVTRQLVAVA
jgi:hypothetical protein